MKRRPSALGFAMVVLLFPGLSIAAGYVSGAIGIGKGGALLVMLGLLVIAVPAAIVVAPDNLLDFLDPRRR